MVDIHVHNRGYLPHFEVGETPQHITFRLYDSLPQALLETWHEELTHLRSEDQILEHHGRMQDALDKGLGRCYLRQPEIAGIVEDTLRHFDRERYHLHEWVIMPNHVHVLATPFPTTSLSSMVHSWKSFTAKRANAFLKRSGQFWQHEYFDRVIRSANHFEYVVAYIHNNPVHAALSAEPTAWPFGSARFGQL